MVSVSKYHATGNDFVLVPESRGVPDRERFAVAVCDRATGIDHPDARERGADGVLYLDLDRGSPPPFVGMELVQPDGSTAAMCGNGVRCVARWATEATGTDAVVVGTGAGDRRAAVDASVTVEMGVPSTAPDAVPLARDEPLVTEPVEGLTVTAVTTGVPHAVGFVDSVAAVDLEAVAPPVRHAAVFPEGANVTLASPRRDGGFDQRTYERGVEGETDSCGTGAVAIAAAAVETGRIARDEPVEVHPPGGRLEVTVTEDSSTLRGPVEHEFDAQVDTDQWVETA